MRGRARRGDLPDRFVVLRGGVLMDGMRKVFQGERDVDLALLEVLDYGVGDVVLHHLPRLDHGRFGVVEGPIEPEQVVDDGEGFRA